MACWASTALPSRPTNPHKFLDAEHVENNSEVVPYQPGPVALTHVAKTHPTRQRGISLLQGSPKNFIPHAPGAHWGYLLVAQAIGGQIRREGVS